MFFPYVLLAVFSFVIWSVLPVICEVTFQFLFIPSVVMFAVLLTSCILYEDIHADFLATFLRFWRDNLESYTSDYTIQVLVGYCLVYIFMQTFMIPGTVFMSLLAGALFGVFKGVALVVFTATAGASSCFFLSKLIGRPLVFSLWPDKLTFFQGQVTVISY